MRLKTVTIPQREETVLEGMPEGHALYVHAALPDGRQLIVVRREGARGAEAADHLLFLGTPDDLVRHEVTCLDTYSDGGSMQFHFREGRTRFVAKPHPSMAKPRDPSWFMAKGAEAVDIVVLASANPRLFLG